VLQLQPFPTVEQACDHVRREDIRHAVMITGAENSYGVVMASKGVKIGKQPLPSLHMSPSLEGRKQIVASKTKAPSKGGGCTHCGKLKHTHETCFKLHGYPEWWNEFKAKKQHEAATNGGSARVALMNSEPQLSLISSIESQNTEKTNNEQGNCGYAFLNSNQEVDNGWIIDLGATDHMTYDSTEFTKITPPRRISVSTRGTIRHARVSDVSGARHLDSSTRYLYVVFMALGAPISALCSLSAGNTCFFVLLGVCFRIRCLLRKNP